MAIIEADRIDRMRLTGGDGTLMLKTSVSEKNPSRKLDWPGDPASRLTPPLTLIFGFRPGLLLIAVSSCFQTLRNLTSRISGSGS